MHQPAPDQNLKSEFQKVANQIRNAARISDLQVVQTAAGLIDRHGKELIEMAGMVVTTKAIFGHYTQQTSVNLSSTIRMFDKCVESHLIERDIHPRMLAEAIDELAASAAAQHRQTFKSRARN